MGVFRKKREAQDIEEPEWCETCQCCKRADKPVMQDLRGFQETFEQANQAKAEEVALEIWGFAFKAAIAVTAAYTIYRMADHYG